MFKCHLFRYNCQGTWVSLTGIGTKSLNAIFSLFRTVKKKKMSKFDHSKGSPGHHMLTGFVTKLRFSPFVVIIATLCCILFPCSWYGWHKGKLGGTDDAGDRHDTFTERHHPYTQVLPHLIGERERCQTSVSSLFHQTDRAHGASAAAHLPCCYTHRLSQPQPPLLLAAWHPTRRTQLPD